jgi:hypothetical protein
MKAVLGGSQSTKSAARVSAFAFLEAQSSPTTGILVKKRPAPSEAAEDKEKLEERIVFKKARKEDNLVSKSGGALFVSSSIITYRCH